MYPFLSTNDLGSCHLQPGTPNDIRRELSYGRVLIAQRMIVQHGKGAAPMAHGLQDDSELFRTCMLSCTQIKYIKGEESELSIKLLSIMSFV